MWFCDATVQYCVCVCVCVCVCLYVYGVSSRGFELWAL